MELSDRHLQVLRVMQQNPGLTIAAIARETGYGSLARRYVYELHGKGLAKWRRFGGEKRWELSDAGAELAPFEHG